MPPIATRVWCGTSLLLGLIAAPLPAQTSSADSTRIVAVVQRYIDAMVAKDTAYLRGASLPRATFVSLVVPVVADSTPTVRTADEFIAGQGLATRRFFGRIWAPRVTIEGPIAVFIAPYDAFFDGVFSHCGMDHYILARSGDRWLVSQLIFTRQRDGCAASPLGPPR